MKIIDTLFTHDDEYIAEHHQEIIIALLLEIRRIKQSYQLSIVINIAFIITSLAERVV